MPLDLIEENKEAVYMKWFDKLDQLHLNPGVQDSENGILFATEYYIGLHMLGLLEPFDKLKSMNTLILAGYPNMKLVNDSHDNRTAAYALSVLNQKPAPKFKFKILHPRDTIFYGYLRGCLWAKPLIFLVGIMHVVSALKMYSRRPKLFERIKWKLQGVEYEEQKFLATSGKKLLILRTYMANSKVLSWFGHLCHLIMEAKMGDNYVEKIFSVYFRNKKHPLRQIYSDVDGGQWWKSFS